MRGLGIINFMKYFLQLSGSFLLIASLALSTGGAADAPAKKVLFFSKSSGYEHSAIKRAEGQMSAAEKVLTELGQKNNLDFTFTKDGTVFTPENIAKYDAFMFYTTGDLTTEGTDKNPPMSKEGKAAFLQAIKDGKGFVGVHSATDTFHTPGSKPYQQNGDNVDPYIRMIGAEFIVHGSQQKVKMIVADKKFPGISGVPDDFGPLEEWYTLKDFAPDLHVLLVQDTSTMIKTGDCENAQDFALHLGQYFQYLTKGGQEAVPLADEYAHAASYMSIQRGRMGERVDLAMDPLPEDCYRLKVPRLILQPLLENAFEHGVRGARVGVVVRVSFESELQVLKIRVEDSGVGISDCDIERLNRIVAGDLPGDESIGILNIHRRIEIRYGEGSGLAFSRSPYGGLRAELSIRREEAPCIGS